MRWRPPQNSTLTIEEFHAKLQEATNFPLRPFVIPFLKVRRTCHPLPSPRGPGRPSSPGPASFSATLGDRAARADFC